MCYREQFWNEKDLKKKHFVMLFLQLNLKH